MTDRYALTLTVADVAVLSRALEFYARVAGMGQVNEAVHAWGLRPDRRGGRLLDDAAAQGRVRDLAVRLQSLLTGLPPHSYVGIAEAEHPQARRAWALHTLLRHRLAVDRPAAERLAPWSVDLDEPEFLGTGPLPVLRPVGPATASQPAPTGDGAAVEMARRIAEEGR